MSSHVSEVDLLVVGSGGGGLAAALTAADLGLSAVVIEKTDLFGGSTALSGGALWIPNNPTLVKAGQANPPDEVLRYLEALTEGKVPAARLQAYVEHGPKLMQMLGRSKRMKFSWCRGYSDYHPDYPGGKALGRSIEAKPINTKILGEEESHQQKNAMEGPLGLWITISDFVHLNMIKRTRMGKLLGLKAAWRVASNQVLKRHMATGGRALIARMRLAMRDAGVPLRLNTAFRELVVEDGRVVGAVVGDGEVIRARKGVLLATGGFEHDLAMRKEHLPEGGQDDVSAGAPGNTGDGIRAGIALGADVDLLDDAWWMPSLIEPRSGDVIVLVAERAIPGAVIVNARGERFTNEASPYVNFVHDQLEGGHVPCWFVMDQKARDRYPFARALPGKRLSRAYYEAGVAHQADTLGELATKLDLPGLVETVERWNSMARRGVDEDFHRGESAYDRYYGDPTLQNPVMDTLEQGPFYAVRLEVGDLGTKGGLVTDEHARVLRADGTAIDGLYATGNTAASVMGNEYAGAGATIGPAMVFGYLAAKHAATR
ncbi:MAG: 3-oxosteroid 1-dehydrogenase [Frankiales bacterium]|jgi:3-oxosteroid 1-dehydrogenase|nr:3-oxosteroid 1-dehydrogenase [Frankiales bacterium]